MPPSRVLLASVLLACAPRTTDPPPQQAPQTSASTPSASTDTRLNRQANYGDLVRSATAATQQRSAESCLLAAHENGFALRGELAPAVRPVPMPAADLDDALKQSQDVELLSAWGRYGNGSAALAFATFTLHAPARDARLLVITDRGIALRGASGSSVQPRQGLKLEDVLVSLSATEPTLVAVAAEATAPLSSVHELLRALDARGLMVALAVNLATDTRLPAPSTAGAAVPRCPEGLPATDAPEGELDTAILTEGVAALRDALPDCLARGDARGAAGGKLTLAFRIAESGRVQEACVARDDIGDPGVAGCVTELARALRFAPPSPSGVLDIELPLALRPPPGPSQRATCTP